jgi:hypothetical protein
MDSAYDLKMANEDLLEMGRWQSELIDEYGVGGNVKGVNSYKNVDVGVLTNWSYIEATLRKGYNLACLGFRASGQLAPYWLATWYEDFGTTVVPRLLAKLPPLIAGLKCPASDGTIDVGLLKGFPGFVRSSLRRAEEA